MLTARQELLLRKVVEGFNATGQPVGSKALAADPDVECGPSTIRNELAVLEERGLLAHPHTSAGRVPTDAGYRYFVESIGESAILPPVEQLMIRHQFGQVQHASEQWFRLAATILAGANRTAAIVTPAKPRSAHVRRVRGHCER